MRCIVHVDMDCFYAQVECARLGLDCRTTPFVLVQWGSLIAVNYPARAAGIRRFFDSFSAAQGKCPELQYSYSPTYRVGETTTQYHPNPQKQTHKVSLEPYREASRKIFHILRHSEPGIEIEKGSIDEAYLDVTAAAEMELARVREAHAATAGAAPLSALDDVLDPETRLIADRTEEMEAFFASRGTTLERVYDEPMRALKRGEMWPEGVGSRHYWVRRGCSDAERAEAEANSLLLCAASRVVARLRARIYAELRYDCSAGIAHNRLLAKCISAAHKPRQQTLLLPDRSASALFDLPLDKVRGFGGKLGDAVREICGGGGDGAIRCRDAWLAPLSRLRIIGSALMDGDDGMSDAQPDREVFDDRPLPERPRTHCDKEALAGGSEATADRMASYDAFFRMRGLDTDVVKPRIMAKSLIAMKHFVAPTTSLAETIPWVTILAAELADRYHDFVAHYRCRGRTLNVKAGTGFLEVADVYNHTTTLPEIVSSETILRVATRALKTVFSAPVGRPSPHSSGADRAAETGRPGTARDEAQVSVTPVESITLTIGGIAPLAGVGDPDALGAHGERHRDAQQTTLTRFIATSPSSTAARKRRREVLGPQRPSRSAECVDSSPEEREAAVTTTHARRAAHEVVELDSDSDTNGNDACVVQCSAASSSVVALSPRQWTRAMKEDVEEITSVATSASPESVHSQTVAESDGDVLFVED